MTTDLNDITVILLKVALNTRTLTANLLVLWKYSEHFTVLICYAYN